MYFQTGVAMGKMRTYYWEITWKNNRCFSLQYIILDDFKIYTFQLIVNAFNLCTLFASSRDGPKDPLNIREIHLGRRRIRRRLLLGQRSNLLHTQYVQWIFRNISPLAGYPRTFTNCAVFKLQLINGYLKYMWTDNALMYIADVLFIKCDVVVYDMTYLFGPFVMSNLKLRVYKLKVNAIVSDFLFLIETTSDLNSNQLLPTCLTGRRADPVTIIFIAFNTYVHWYKFFCNLYLVKELDLRIFFFFYL